MHLKLSTLILLICIISPGITAQDILFKTNGDKVSAKVLLKSRYELTYRISGAQDSLLHHISTSALDSALYSDGTKDIFTLSSTADIQSKYESLVYGSHLVGFDLGAFLFYNQSLSVSYEYLLLKQQLGVKVQFGMDPKELWYYDLMPDGSATGKGRFSRFGLNWYFYPPGSFRVSTGLHYIGSKYSYQGERWIYDQEPPYGSHVEYVKGDRKYRFVVFSAYAYYQIFKNLAVNAGIDFPARGPNNPGAIFRSEILLNF
jgi:hypothetical protein